MRGRERRVDSDLHATQVFVDGVVTSSVETCVYIIVLDITNIYLLLNRVLCNANKRDTRVAA